MKHPFRHKLLLGLLLFTALFSSVPSQVFAVAGTVYFVASSSTVTTGNELAVEVRGNVPSPITWPFYGGGTTMIVTYDTSKLQVVSYNDTGGVFASGSKSWSATAGTVRYQSTIGLGAPGVANQKIISIQFKALIQGSTTLNFGSGISVNDGPTTGTPSALNIVNPTCPAGQVGTPPNCTTPTPSPTPTPAVTPKPTVTTKPTATPTPAVSVAPTPEESVAPVASSDGGLKIENVKTTTTRQQNAVGWTINSYETEQKFSYGTAKNNQKTEVTAKKQEDGSYQVALPGLKLGTLYYFTIKASTTDQLQGATYSGTFTTRGYPVQLVIQQNSAPAPNAKVKIGERSFTANKEALITTELGDGAYSALVTVPGTSEAQSVKFTVAKKAIPANGNPATQTFILNTTTLASATAESADNGRMVAIIGAAIAGIVGIAAAVGFLLYRKKKQQQVDTTVDSDLLAASYGSALQEYRVQTPAPNLDLQATYTAVQAPEPSTQQIAEAPEPPIAVTQSAATTPQLPELPPEATLPLPPAAVPTAPQAQSYPQPIAPAAPTVTPQNDDTSSNKAVYHPETGELEILHGGTRHTAGGTL